MHFFTGGVDTASDNGIFDISNSDRLGFSEVELMQNVVDGITKFVKMEKLLEKGKSIDDLLPPGTVNPDEPLCAKVSSPKRIFSGYPGADTVHVKVVISQGHKLSNLHRKSELSHSQY